MHLLKRILPYIPSIPSILRVSKLRVPSIGRRDPDFMEAHLLLRSTSDYLKGYEMRRILLISFVAVLLAQNVYGQKEGVTHAKFRALLHSGERIVGKNGYFTLTNFHGTLNTGEEVTIEKSEIKLMDVSSGSKVFEGAALGAGIGLTVCLFAILDVAIDPLYELDNEAIGPVTLGITGAGAVIGGLIGASKTKWKRLPIRTVFMFNPKIKGGLCMIEIPLN